MVKCDCYHKVFGKEVCYGTKEREECKCGGDAIRCDFYPTRRAMAICEDRVTDIFTLLQKVRRKGYELTFRPDELHIGAVKIKLSDPETMHHIEIRMGVDQNYFKEPNSIIFETIGEMFKDMDNYKEV